MRLRKALLIIGSFILILLILTIYSAKDLMDVNKSPHPEMHQEQWIKFADRVKNIEESLNKNHEDVKEIKSAIKTLIRTNTSTSLTKEQTRTYTKRTSNDLLFDETCPIQLKIVPKPNIQMLKLYDRISFDNSDGGTWKQGWRIEINERDWNRHNKLHVFVVPHSHNDPGWIKTFEEYYLSQTKHILNNMLQKLPIDTTRKFIWAEISYFSMWWDEIGEDEREAVRRLIKNKQLEFVTGGWVMNDEANSHWLSIVSQLTEGHQWLQQNLNYTPESSWSIDPFGMSSLQPLLLKEMGVRNMLVQRVHYAVKKELARRKQLEFRWRQPWDGSGASDMFTHMMPFYSYDIPHTCGPDPKVCCQFDFKRLPGHGLHCPWKMAPVKITHQNVAERAALLLDQYRKKSQLYSTNVLLVPLGDDFRYDHPTEWDVQYENYQTLFDHMNANEKLNVRAEFGTLSDYFDALHRVRRDEQFPSLSGDFFTYADRDDHYWSGYFTSRPFYKRMDRILLGYVRAAEIILSMAYLSGNPGSDWIADREMGLERQMADARKALALFQHHDGITGTAKREVVIDYGKKMLAAIGACQHVIQHSAHILLLGEKADAPDLNSMFYNVDDVRGAHNSIGERYQITIGPELSQKRIAIFNSMPFTRTEVVTFYVSTPYVEVLDMKGKPIPCQIAPIFEFGAIMSQNKYQLSFIANIPALGLMSFIINAVFTFSPKTTPVEVNIYNHYGEVKAPSGFATINVSPSAKEFTLHNNRIIASFNKLGILKAIKMAGKTIPIHLDFIGYGARQSREMSGAYLFLPDGPGIPIINENTLVRVIVGPIVSRVCVQLQHIHHCATLYNTTGADSVGIEIENVVDIPKKRNFELAMRFLTSIKNGDTFYTDLNGYDIIRRKRFAKLPLQANYYPIPAMAYIEDETTRLSLITGSPLGASSLKEGEIEVMLDRTLQQDDNRGMGQGVTDNVPTKHVFRLIVEQKAHPCQASVEGHPSGFPTLAAYVSMQTLQNPLIRLLRTEDTDTTSQNSYVINAQNADFGVDYNLGQLRTGVTLKGSDYIGLILQRQFIDVCYSDAVLLKQFPLSDGNVNIGALLFDSSVRQVKSKLFRASLSYMYLKEEIKPDEDLKMCPMEIKAFVLQR